MPILMLRGIRRPFCWLRLARPANCNRPDPVEWR